jgi:Ca-activated chloride channel family protein
MMLMFRIAVLAQHPSDSANSAMDKKLWVLDGAKSSREEVGKLDPGDIESIDVWNGKSATAIYGEKASEGAIAVTTKKGSKKRVFDLLRFAYLNFII